MASAFFWQNCVSLLPALFSKGTRWQSRKTCSSSPGKTRKLQLTAEQLSIGECWIPPKKDSPHPRAKEKLQQDSRRSKITFRIKPHTHQRHSEGSNKTFYAAGESTETEPDLTLSVCMSPVEVWVSSCCFFVPYLDYFD